MKQHGKRYAALPLQRQQEYTIEAHNLRDKAATATSEELHHLKHAFALHRSRSAELDAVLDLPCLLSNCRFTTQQLDQLQSTWKKLAVGMKVRRIEETLQRIRPPKSLPLEFAEHLSMFDVPLGFFPTFSSKTPTWAKLVCRHRDVMGGAVLQFTFGPDVQHFLICFVMRSPHLVVATRLQNLPQDLPLLPVVAAELLDVIDGLWAFAWCLPAQTEYITDKDLPNLDVQDVAVVPDVMWNTAGDLVSANDAIPLTDYLQDLPKVAKDKPEQEQVNDGNLLDEEALAQLPWLREYAFLAAHTHVLQSSGSSRLGEASALPLHDHDQEEIDASYEALLERRRLMELEPAHRTDGFATKILGGKWTLQYKNKAYDAIAGTSCTDHAKRFCTTLGLNSMASFAIAKFTEDVANRLALEWVAIMSHFYAAWQTSNDDKALYFSEKPPYQELLWILCPQGMLLTKGCNSSEIFM